MNIEELINKLDFDTKARLLTGAGALTTYGCEAFGIPELHLSDGPHGIRRLIKHPNKAYEQVCNIKGGDVCFPTASALGSSWNRDMVKQVGRAIALDCKEEGIEMLLSPGVNMKRTPLCGRNFEYYSEDPYLSGELGAAFIEGVEEEGIATSLKHFAANNQEIWRSFINVEIDERSLREYYLRPFEIAVKKGKPASVMCAYNKLGGIWCSENKWLLEDLLRKEWGFEGIIVSDWYAVHSPSKALFAGIDLQMPKNEHMASHLQEGIKRGIITEKDMDRALKRLIPFFMKYQAGESCSGLEETRQPAQSETIKISIGQSMRNCYDRNEQHELAKAAALESITLLKNHGDILPIQANKYKKIVVFGIFANEPVIMGGGSSKVTVEEASVEKPLNCIKAIAGEDMEVIYEPLYPLALKGLAMDRKIEEMAKEADISLVFMANEEETETEGIDRKRLAFSDYMNDATDIITAICRHTVVIMQTGACTAPSSWKDRAEAIIQMWLGGEGGGSAIAKVLFGLYNPSGKLSETFVLNIREDLDYPSDGVKIWYKEGMFSGYRYYDTNNQDVWYPFGHGLSYTTFEYSQLSVTPEYSEDNKQTVIVSLKVKNTGTVAGSEVVQLYVGKQDSIVLRPLKTLEAFEKAGLLPGEEKEIKFELSWRAFSYYNPYLKEWHVESGEYQIMAAASSADIRLKGKYIVNWEKDYTRYSDRSAIIL